MFLFGLLVLVAGSAFGGKIALHGFANGAKCPLLIGLTISSTAAVLGCIIDIGTRQWAILRAVSFEQALDPGFVITTTTLYVGAAAYIVTVVYYRRLIPFDLSGFRTRRRRP